MTPDELRAHADRIADRYNIQDGDAALWRSMVHVVQAARDLANVIEYAESDAPALMQASVQAGYVREGAQAAKAHVLRIAHGEVEL